MIERTLVLIKPDGVSRALVGKIISRFEDAGLKVAAMKMLRVEEDRAEKHYFVDENWAKSVFEKAKSAYEKMGKALPFKNHMDAGRDIQNRNKAFLKEGPVVALVLEGAHAIELVRKMVGATEPRQAAPGTIRGDFASVESYSVADERKRVLRNLVHASDSLESAKREVELWFTEEEIHSYQTAHEMASFGK